MDASIYKAAIEGDFRALENNSVKYLVIMPINNTVLHTHIISQDKDKVSTTFAEKILKRFPSLLLKANVHGDTILHTAAKYGYDDIVEVVIRCAEVDGRDRSESSYPIVQQLLRMENNERNTALHVAVQHDNTLAAKRLIKKDPNIRYLPNSYGETPLYMAVLNSKYSTVYTMLNECKSIAYEAPDGMTVLHVAATNYYTDITKKILENKGKLTNVTDQYGWTLLHHAAYYTSDIDNVKVLLEFDGSAAFIADKERKMTPLHMAAAMGRKDIMHEIISQCPDCCEMVDNRGWNFLHFAAISLTINGFDELIS